MALPSRILSCRRLATRLQSARSLGHIQPYRALSSTPKAQQYLGQELSEEAALKIGQRNHELREEHHRFRSEYPEAAQPSVGQRVDPWFAHKKKLIYRSKQRGWLEVDLLLGTWATENVMEMSESELKEYEDILNQETLDIYNMITKQMEVPEELDGQVMKKLQEFAVSSPIGTADPKKYSEIKEKMSN